MRAEANGHGHNQLLLACVSAQMAPERIEQIRVLASGSVDWAALTAEAHRQGVLPLVYRGLSEACPDVVPDAVISGLRAEFNNNARRNLFLTAELLRVLQLLESEGVFAVPYKGSTLAALVYGDLALREFSDNDIMIRLEDLPRVRKVLLAADYRPEISLSPAQEIAYLRSRHSMVFIDQRWSIVEVHWAFQPRYFAFSLDPTDLAERLEPVPLVGRTVKTFSREDLLLILALHGAKHMWSRAEWICDLALLVHRGSDIDWEGVFERSRRLGVMRMLLLGLHLTREILSTSLPPRVQREIATDPHVSALVPEVRKQLFDGNGVPGIMESSAFYIRARERFADKVRYCARLAATPYVQDWAAVPLPDAASPLYYVIRPFRMMATYAAAVLRRH